MKVINRNALLVNVVNVNANGVGLFDQAFSYCYKQIFQVRFLLKNYLTMSHFFNRALTVSVGCAPLASHF